MANNNDALMQAASQYEEQHQSSKQSSSHRPHTPTNSNNNSTTSVSSQELTPRRDQKFLSSLKANYSPRQSQVIENYHDFRMGQGDPLLKEVMKSHESTYRKMGRNQDEILDANFHSSQTVTGYLNDMVHVGDEVISVPCLPFTNDENRE